MPRVVLEGDTNRALQEKKKVEVKIMKEKDEEMKEKKSKRMKKTNKKKKTKKKKNNNNNSNGEIRSLRVVCDLSANF